METFIDNVSGYMYHGGDVDALQEKIEKFLSLSNRERKAMGEAGRRHIEENFSREKVIEAYLETINKLV
jgi:galacturonosyltransferase